MAGNPAQDLIGDVPVHPGRRMRRHLPQDLLLSRRRPGPQPLPEGHVIPVAQDLEPGQSQAQPTLEVPAKLFVGRPLQDEDVIPSPKNQIQHRDQPAPVGIDLPDLIGEPLCLGFVPEEKPQEIRKKTALRSQNSGRPLSVPTISAPSVRMTRSINLRESNPTAL